MEVEDMTITAEVINKLLEAIAQLIEARTGDSKAAEIVRGFKIGA